MNSLKIASLGGASMFAKLSVALLSLGAASLAHAEPAVTLSTVHAFAEAEGISLMGRLLQGSDGNFYGTSQQGGAFGVGSVYRITPSGKLKILYSFTNAHGVDGGYPIVGLVAGRDGNFYGTTGAGDNYDGTIFRISPSGKFTTLRQLANDDGYNLPGTLVQGRDGNFYGMTQYGGTGGSGTVFKMTPQGEFSTIYAFTGGADGAYPSGTLIQGSDGNLYGTTSSGGSGSNGTVFKITTAGQLTSLHSFTGKDGRYPMGGVIQASDGNFYGTADAGGANGYGTVFRMTPKGKITTLHSFNIDDGAYPSSALLQGTDGRIYGTALGGGEAFFGTLFSVTMAGEFAVMYSFDEANGHGYSPFAGLTQGHDGTLYGVTQGGMTQEGVKYDNGTVFKLTFDPALPKPKVNASFATTIVSSKYTPWPGDSEQGFTGVYTVRMQFCNVGTVALGGLYTQTKAIDANASLINRAVGGTEKGNPGGVGSQLMFPTKSIADVALGSGECLTVPYELGLTSGTSASIDLNVYGHQ